MSDWWSRKLSGDKAPATRPLPPVPAQNYPVTHQPPADPVSTKTTFTKAQSVCPGCGGDNYFSMGTAKPRCYDCGYPLEQQSTGMTGGDGSPATPARQVPSAGYQPQNTAAGRIQ
jgi:hypothetical protein